MKSSVVTAMVNRAILLNLPAEAPGAGPFSIHNFHVWANHLRNGRPLQSKFVRGFRIQNFDHKLRVIRRRAMQGAGGGVTSDSRPARFLLRQRAAVFVMWC